MRRREFLQHAAATAVVAGGSSFLPRSAFSAPPVLAEGEQVGPRPAFSVVPVVGDGKWIWKQPPADQTGYLEPRSFEVKVGMSLEGTGAARGVTATTTVPVEHPEQKIEDLQIQTQGRSAAVRELEPGAGQLRLSAAGIQAGQVVAAVATFRLTISKQYHGYEQAMFPQQQEPTAEVRKRFLQNSPGIETSSREVRELAEKLTAGAPHPWDQAKRFAEWSAENIRARLGTYTSVVAALRDRVGDCEERSAVFVAFCRAVGIPARLVWIPNHNWAEFYLEDEEGQGHWIPAHTACYSWFGWVGAHELVLRKGDRVYVPERQRQ